MTQCKYKLDDLRNGEGCDNVMSGVKTVLIGLIDDVAVWPQEIDNPTSMEENVMLVGLPVMKPGKRMFKLYSKNDAGEYQCIGQGEEGSRSQQASLNIYNPGFRKSINGFIRAVQNAQLLIICLTNQGEWHVMGDQYRGAVLSEFTSTSGKSVTDPNGADMTFIYNTPSDRVIELTDAQVETLCSISGSVAAAAISAVGESNVLATGATLEATFTENDETISKVGFRYKVEGTSAWDTVSTTNFISGTPWTKAVTGLTSNTDYLFYAFMVVDGQERYSGTYTFKTA